MIKRLFFAVLLVGLLGSPLSAQISNPSVYVPFLGVNASPGAVGTVTMTGLLTNTAASTSGTNAAVFTGTWFAGTTPHVLIQPTGATPLSYNANGTGLAINAPSGYTGDLWNFGQNGTSLFKYDASTGNVTFSQSGRIISNGQSISSNTFQSLGTNNQIIFGVNSQSSAVSSIKMSTGTFTHSSGVGVAVNINPTENETSTAGFTSLQIRATETALGSGTHLLADFGTTAGGSKFSISNTGAFSATGSSTITSGNLTLSTDNRFGWASQSLIGNTADGVLFMSNNAASVGVIFQASAAPTIASGFGSGAAITIGSSDSSGEISVGTTPGTGGVINFAATWSKAPNCMVNDGSTTVATRATSSTTQLTITGTLTNSDKVEWICLGMK